MYIAFLRGINVSGKNKIDMNSLKDMFESMGLTHIVTYINTGNVLFDSDVEINEGELEDKIKLTFDLDIKVMIRTQAEVIKLVESFDLNEGPKNCYITLFKSNVANTLESAVEKVKQEEDLYSIQEKSLFLYVPNGYGRSKLTNNYFEKKSGVSATTRNLKTMTKMSEML